MIMRFFAARLMLGCFLRGGVVFDGRLPVVGAAAVELFGKRVRLGGEWRQPKGQRRGRGGAEGENERRSP